MMSPLRGENHQEGIGKSIQKGSMRKEGVEINF